MSATPTQVAHYEGLVRELNEADEKRGLKPVCQKCYWRMGGPDSWDGVSCKCGARIKRGQSHAVPPAADQSRALAHYVPLAREAELHATIERLHADLCAARRDHSPHLAAVAAMVGYVLG